jgi:hypothetical protein
MSSYKHLILAIFLFAFVIPHSQSAIVSVEEHFFQGGFAGGGFVSGFFRGTDEDGDGRIYSASNFFGRFGLPKSNEVDYAELTFSNLGTSLGSQTFVYDKNIADVDDPANMFFAFAYNIGSGTIGDEANEGISFSPFAPSTNYLLGEAFLPLFIDSLAEEDRSSFGSCDGINNCGAVLELVIDGGLKTVSQNLSASLVNVSAPASLGIISIALLWLTRGRSIIRNA